MYVICGHFPDLFVNLKSSTLYLCAAGTAKSIKLPTLPVLWSAFSSQRDATLTPGSLIPAGSTAPLRLSLLADICEFSPKPLLEPTDKARCSRKQRQVDYPEMSSPLPPLIFGSLHHHRAKLYGELWQACDKMVGHNHRVSDLGFEEWLYIGQFLDFGSMK